MSVRSFIMMMNIIIKKIIYFINHDSAQYRKEIISSLIILLYGFLLWVFLHHFIQKIESLTFKKDFSI